MVESFTRGLVAAGIVFGAVLDGGAQTSTGGLRGFVRDNSDLVMVGVTVEGVEPGAHRRAGGGGHRPAGRLHVFESACRRLHAGVHAAGLHDSPS